MKPIRALLLGGALAGNVYTGTPTTMAASLAGNTTITGGLTVSKGAASPYGNCKSLDAKTTGRFYMECKVNAIGATKAIGIGVGDHRAMMLHTPGTYFGGGNFATLMASGSNSYSWKQSGGSLLGTTWAANDIVCMDVDVGARTIKFKQNGGAWSSAQTISGTLPLTPFCFLYDATDQVTWYFDHSTWTYAAPSGCDQWSVSAALTGRYWRYFPTGFVGSDGLSISTVNLKLTTGGADQTGSGTATAHNSFSIPTYQPSNAVDGNNTTMWADSGGHSTDGYWDYDFGSGVQKAIREITWGPRQDGVNQYCPHWTWSYSDDQATWYPGVSRNDMVFTNSSGNLQTFAVCTP